MPNSTVMTSANTPLWRQIWEFPLIAMVVALAVLALTEFAFVQLGGFMPNSLDPNITIVISGVIAIVLMVLVNKFVVARLGYVKHDDLPGEGALGDSALGIFVGLAVISAAVGLAALVGVYRVEAYGPAGDMVVIVVQAALVVAVFQEVVFRGIVLRFLVPITGSLLALFLSCLAFTAYFSGITGAGWAESLVIAVTTGLLFGGTYLLTNNLWLSIGAHAGWNAGLGLVWGMPVLGVQYQGFLDAALIGPNWVTGGYLGLQAGVIALVVAAAAGIWMIRQAAKEGHIIPPVWSR